MEARYGWRAVITTESEVPAHQAATESQPESGTWVSQQGARSSSGHAERAKLRTIRGEVQPVQQGYLSPFAVKRIEDRERTKLRRQVVGFCGVLL
jgi:hypothetical protein